MLNSFRNLLFLLIILLPALSHGQTTRGEGVYGISGNPLSINELPSVNSLFETSRLLKVQIETNLERLILFKEDPDYQKATFTITVSDTILVVKKIKIKVRGKTRIILCEDPPLKIDFKKTDFQWEWFDKLKSLKVVTPCDDPKIYTRYLLKEYFAYVSYNVLTDMSYKVRLIELTLKDSQHELKPEVKYAFLVENDRKLAKRTKSEEIELKDTNTGALVQNFYLNPTDETLFNINLLALYQYMIGNTDWTTSRFHNIKVFEKEDALYPVPYDFDYSGLVNTNYAIPSSSTPIDNVRERCYLGPCSSRIQFDKAVTHILDKRGEITDRLVNDPNISKKSKDEMFEYIEEFYSSIADPVLLETLRTANCSNLSNSN